MKKLLTVLIAAALALTAYPAFAAIQNSPHDLSGPTYSYGLCEACHVPHAAAGSKRLWRLALTPFPGTFHNWSTSRQIGVSLCGLCHLPTGVLLGKTNKASQGSHNMFYVVGTDHAGAFSDTSHGSSMTVLGNLDNNDAAISGKPYTAADVKMECTSCHNPHQDEPGNGSGIRPFLRATKASPEPISDFCGECHTTRESTGLTTADNTTDGGTTGATLTAADPAGVTGTPTGGWNHNHPVNIAYGNNDLASENGFYKGLSATPLNSTAPLADSAPALGGWNLGGKFLDNNGAPIPTANLVIAAPGSSADATHFIGCQTCHAVHNPATDTTLLIGGTGPRADATWLLAVSNTGNGGATPDGRADLCETCHGRTGAGRWGTIVGGTSGGDHPIDGAISTDAINTFITSWSGPSHNFTGSARVTVDRSLETWPQGTVTPSGLYSGYQIICTSCHSAHRAGARLRRQGGDTTDWCKSCHPSVAPLGHHSNIDNLAGSTVKCIDCHVSALGGGGEAHNGFSFYNVAGDNTGSTSVVPWNQAITAPTTQLANSGSTTGCTSCHFLGTSLIEPGSNIAPINRLGTAVKTGAEGTGAQTHYMGAIASNGGTVGIHVKTSAWNTTPASNPGPMIPDHTGHRRDYSKYGTVLPGFADYTSGGHEFTPNVASGGNIQFVGCESCHSVLGNIGRTAALANVSSGWENNLLLQDYRDDSYSTGSDTSKGAGLGLTETNARTVGSEFCVGCHNQNKDILGTGTNPGPVNASVVIGDGQGGTGTNTIAPPGMHPMTGWFITKAKDVGRAITSLVTDDVDGTYADAGTTRPTATGTGGAANGTDGNAQVANQGAVSYPGTNQMDCDSCHRPHNANPQSYSNSSHITVRTATSETGDAPTILENAVVHDDNGSLCTQCHNY